jgi:predicted O-methyltransferase YrrM
VAIPILLQSNVTTERDGYERGKGVPVMGMVWRLVKTVSRVHKPWRQNIKQYENFFRRDHYYSPIPVVAEVQRREHLIFDRQCRSIPGIDLCEDQQLALLEQFRAYGEELPFSERPSADSRYWLDNRFFPYSDGVFYYSLIRHCRPKRVIEIGSGYSSAVFLDTNERFFDRGICGTCIDPDTSRLDKLMTEADRANTRVLRQTVQDVPLEEFERLQAGDILFVDSSHVAKVGSDVNDIFFRILPALASGVYVHVHDIFYPFEYPKHWVYGGWAWNEAYLLRAFLQFNRQFQIAIWPDFLQQFHRATMDRCLPQCHTNSGSIWLRKN